MKNDTVQDKGYFMRRAAQERSAAEHASGTQAREAHMAMAERYQKLAGRVGDAVDGPAA